MSDLSVTRVQDALRELAQGGHDMISHVGGLSLFGKHYPMAYAHGLELPDNQRYHKGYTMLPVSESGNAVLVYSDNGPKTTGTWSQTVRSTSLMNPLTFHHREPKHWYETHSEITDFDWIHDNDMDIHKAINNMGKVPSLYRVYERDGEGDKLKVTEDWSRIKEHDPAEASWNTITNNMRFGHEEWAPHPKELNLRTLGRVVHVYDRRSDTSHLYHPETEQLIKI